MRYSKLYLNETLILPSVVSIDDVYNTKSEPPQ
jgi:hypothetical protein